MLWLLLLLLISAFVAYAAYCNRKNAIPGALHLPTFPLVGHAFLVQNNPARVFMGWAKKYNRACFVIRLGTTPVLVVNSHSAVSELWIRHSQATSSRPVFHTFHNIVLASQGFTVGLTPTGASCQRKKKCIGKQLSPKHVGLEWTAEITNSHSKRMVKHLLRRSTAMFPGRTTLDDQLLLRHAQYFVLGCALEYTYGIHLDAYGKHQKIADTVVETENQIIRLRLPLANYQDYVPGMKWLAFSSKAEMAAKSRDQYMDRFFQVFQHKLHHRNQEAANCLLGRVSTDIERLSAAETRSICLTMVSAGLDNIALSFDHLMGQMATPKGYKMQERLFQELCKIYSSSAAAWDAVVHENASVYGLALIHETMRYFTVLPLSLPRETTRAVLFRGMFIPRGTILLMNAYAADHDEAVFEKPYEFIPERWIDENGRLVPETNLRHFGFGAGSRKCSGIALAVKEFYILLCRTVLVFHIKRPLNPADEMGMDPFESNLCPLATSFEPREFKVWLRPRFSPGYGELHEKIYS